MLLLEVNSISWQGKYISFPFCRRQRSCALGATRWWMRCEDGTFFNGQTRKAAKKKNGRMKNYLLLRINETVHFSFAAIVGWGRRLYCCVHFWLKRWSGAAHSTMECLSAPTRNCGRKRYIYEILKSILFGSSALLAGEDGDGGGVRKKIIRFVHTTKDRRQAEELRVKTFR